MRRSAVFFCMRGAGHFNRLRPLIRGLVERGVDAHVFTRREFAAQVEADGGRFVDVFAQYSDTVDAESWPRTCRELAFAGTFAADLIRDVGRLGPSLIVYDTFAIIGFVVARELGVPYVNVCAGHNVEPRRFVAGLSADPNTRVSLACVRAVETLRDRYGIENASPFFFVATQSPFLNLYCEPPEFLKPSERTPFEPIAFFGSLPAMPSPAAVVAPAYFSGNSARIRAYVSFGTNVLGVYPALAATALGSLVGALAEVPGVEILASRGGEPLPERVEAALRRPNVVVHDYVDQPRVLREADVFFTHHGLNSTHEAVDARVPMVSCPFFWDQPGLALRCQELGLAVPLWHHAARDSTEFAPYPVGAEAVTRALPGAREEPGELASAPEVRAALDAFVERRDDLRARLEEARRWELDVIARRPAVFERLMELM